MKLYLAGPMTGLPEYNYPAFAIAREVLRRAGYEVVCPAEQNPDGPKQAVEGQATWLDFMRRDIREAVLCDGVAMLEGWKLSRGASLEVEVMRRLGLPTRMVADWLKDEAYEM